MAEAPLELGKEYPPQGEEAQIEQILAISKFSMQHKPHPPMLRDQHPKSHGCVQGELIVEEDIPETMKVGVFKESKTYPIWIRFSNGGSDRDPKTGDFVPDTVGDVRGMAIKLMDERLHFDEACRCDRLSLTSPFRGSDRTYKKKLQLKYGLSHCKSCMLPHPR
jgi:catalase